MATLKEIMAAKAAKSATPPPSATVSGGGKGVVLSAKASPDTGHGVPIRLPAPPPLKPEPEPRVLGDTTPGADVPFEFASEKPSEAAKDWLAARQALDTSLGIWIEPGQPEMAWLALDSSAEPGRLLLLYRLPLLCRREENNPY